MCVAPEGYILKQDREADEKTCVMKNSTIFYFPCDEMEMPLKLQTGSFEKFTKGGFFRGDQAAWLNAKTYATFCASEASRLVAVATDIANRSPDCYKLQVCIVSGCAVTV